MEHQQYVLLRVYLITMAITAAVVFLTFLDLQSTFLRWALPSVATAAWIVLAVAAFFQVVLTPRPTPEIHGRFTGLYLAARETFIVVGGGVVVWVIWSAYGPL